MDNSRTKRELLSDYLSEKVTIEELRDSQRPKIDWSKVPLAERIKLLKAIESKTNNVANNNDLQ